MIKAILFDTDGMVVKRSYFSDRLTRDYGVPKEEVMRLFRNEFKDCVIGRADLKQVLIQYLPRWGWPGSVEELLQYWFAGEAELNQPILAQVKVLQFKGVKAILATNQEKYRLAFLKEQMKLEQVFSQIICSCEVGAKKPEPEFFRKIVESTELSPEEIMYWDDTEENIQAGQAFGFDSHLYQNLDDFQSIINKL